MLRFIITRCFPSISLFSILPIIWPCCHPKVSCYFTHYFLHFLSFSFIIERFIKVFRVLLSALTSLLISSSPHFLPLALFHLTWFITLFLMKGKLAVTFRFICTATVSHLWKVSHHRFYRPCPMAHSRQYENLSYDLLTLNLDTDKLFESFSQLLILLLLLLLL